MSVARVQPRGQVTVPQSIRLACGIEPGMDLLFCQTGPDTFECRRLPVPRSLSELVDALAGNGVAPDLAELRNEMGDELEAEQLGGNIVSARPGR